MKKNINSGRQVVVGLNKFVMDELDRHEPFRVDMAIEEKAKSRLRAYKARREEAAVKAALTGVENACEALKAGTGDLMPALIDAARKGATNGEMIAVMRQAFGWYVSE